MWITIVIIVLLFIVIACVMNAQKIEQVFKQFTSNESFEQNNTQSASFVFLKANWCGHCKNVLKSGEVDKLRDMLKKEGLPINIVMIDSEEKDKIKKYNIRGFPTFFLDFNDGTEPVELDCKRNADSWINLIKQILNNRN